MEAPKGPETTFATLKEVPRVSPVTPEVDGDGDGVCLF